MIPDILKPDDFADQPYVGGCNQGLHASFGSSLLWVALHYLSMPYAIFAAGGVVLLLEYVQLRFLRAKRADYFRDLFYWYSGIAVYAQWPEYAVPLPIVAFVIEYVRIKWTRTTRNSPK